MALCPLCQQHSNGGSKKGPIPSRRRRPRGVPRAGRLRRPSQRYAAEKTEGKLQHHKLTAIPPGAIGGVRAEGTQCRNTTMNECCTGQGPGLLARLCALHKSSYIGQHVLHVGAASHSFALLPARNSSALDVMFTFFSFLGAVTMNVICGWSTVQHQAQEAARSPCLARSTLVSSTATPSTNPHSSRAAGRHVVAAASPVRSNGVGTGIQLNYELAEVSDVTCSLKKGTRMTKASGLIAFDGRALKFPLPQPQCLA